METVVSPASAAFAIWGLIYTLMIIFVVYQALPASWVPGRDDDLIFKQIGWIFPINMMMCVGWWATFLRYTVFGYAAGEMFIIGMLVTALMMQEKVMEAVNTTGIDAAEMIGLRGFTSTYAGWLCAATILGMSGLLKKLGMSDANGYDEASWTVAILW